MLIKLNYGDFLFCRETYDNCVKTILTSSSNTIGYTQTVMQTDRHTLKRAHTYDVIHSVCLQYFHTFVISACANQNSIEFLDIQSSFNRRTQTIKSHGNCAVISMNHHDRRTLTNEWTSTYLHDLIVLTICAEIMIWRNFENILSSRESNAF